MNKRKFVFPFFIVLLSMMLTLPALGQADQIIVSNADALTTVAVTGSSNLNTLIGNVAPRFVVQFANYIKYYGMTPISATLQTLIGQVSNRFVLEHANADRFYAFAYPVGLVGDATPPLINTVGAKPLGSGSEKISWLTDEFATSTLQYGTQPGIYTQTITDPLYYKLHEVPVTGLIPGKTYYYLVSSTDRSGNTAQSQEHSFIATTFICLPLIRR